MSGRRTVRPTRANVFGAVAAGAAVGVCAAIGAVIGAGAALHTIALDAGRAGSVPARKTTGRYAERDPLIGSRDAEASRWFEETRSAVELRDHDGLRLRAWRFDPDTARPGDHRYAICVHGYAGSPAEMAPWAHHYAKLGFSVLVPAQRAHERSEGRFATMGWRERRDLMQWVNLVVAHDPRARIVLHGNSMGAVAVLLACADGRLAPHVVGAVADSAYCSMREQLEHSVSSMLRVPAWLTRPAVACADLINRMRLGFGFGDVDALEAMGRIHVPLLLVQGTADEIVAPSSGRRLHDACANADVTLLEIRGARHTAGFAADPERYWSVLDAFAARAVERGAR